LSTEYGVKASRNKKKGRVVENSEDELRFNCLSSETGWQEESTDRDLRRHLYQREAPRSITGSTIKTSYEITPQKIVTKRRIDLGRIVHFLCIVLIAAARMEG
jgi:hypothetical protein